MASLSWRRDRTRRMMRGACVTAAGELNGAARKTYMDAAKFTLPPIRPWWVYWYSFFVELAPGGAARCCDEQLTLWELRLFRKGEKSPDAQGAAFIGALQGIPHGRRQAARFQTAKQIQTE